MLVRFARAWLRRV